MSKADEMFEKLGYKRKDMGAYNELNILYENKDGLFINFIPGVEGITTGENTVIFKEELQAINEKVKELRLEQLNNT